MSASARIAGYPRTKSEVINLLETTRMIVRRAEPPLLEAYLSLNAIFEKSSLTNTERQLVMLAVSQANGCEYCLPVDRVPSLISLSGPTRAPSPRSGSATFGGLEMLRTGFLWLIWSLAFWGTLKLSDAPILQDHGVCGIWGCGPPTNALLACHLGWMVFLAPSIPLAFHYFPHRRQLLSVVFCVLFSAGLLGVLGTGIHQLVTWYPNATELARSYFLRRWGFAVVTLTDFPMVQLFLYGLTGLGWQKYVRSINSEPSLAKEIAAATVLAGSVDS